IYERYTDSAAAMVHLGNFGDKFADRFMALLTPVSFKIWGPASQELRDATSPLGAKFFDHVGGFAR
ncbi:MAG: antibiotic biosynthesis monooxygenase, partial [Planctomycetota bacterium]